MLRAPLGSWSRMVASISKSYQVDPNFQLHDRAKQLSQHLD